jgi:hypothetical protein
VRQGAGSLGRVGDHVGDRSRTLEVTDIGAYFRETAKGAHPPFRDGDIAGKCNGTFEVTYARDS